MSPTRRIAVLFSVLAAAAAAQTHHVAPPEKVTRAIAVYEWTGDLANPTASRLVPISLFISGHFEDAGLYLARPVPFALEPGDLYSVEEAGLEKGTLAIEHARDFTTGRLLADQDPVGAWYGFGRFAPLAAPKPPPALHASTHPSVIVASSDPDRPRLTNKADNTPPADPKPATDTATPAKTSDDPDRPTLGRRRESNSDTSDSGSGKKPNDSADPGTASSGSSTPKDTDPERPSLRKRTPENTGRRSPPQAGVTGPDRPLNDDPDRPIIRHGKTPVEQDAAELKGVPADLHQVAAVSDPARREPHLFAREWDSTAERTGVLGRLQALAHTQVAAYLAQNHLTPGVPPAAAPASPSKPSAPATAAAAGSTADRSNPSDSSAPTLRRTPGGVSTATAAPPVPPVQAQPAPVPPKAGTNPSNSARTARVGAAAKSTKAKKPAPALPLTFSAEDLRGYLLSYGGLPTFVYTAQVPVTAGGTVYVTLLAQRLPSGELQVALQNVTDSAHLDRTPWMRPIDAVDPDASHRASLLFELRAQTSRQFALYRLLSARAEQQFLSQPIQ